MVFDVARVRGLYTSLGDGWTYLNAHQLPQVPERVSSGVASAFRMHAQMPFDGGEPFALTQLEQARATIAGTPAVEAGAYAAELIETILKKQVSGVGLHLESGA